MQISCRPSGQSRSGTIRPHLPPNGLNERTPCRVRSGRAFPQCACVRGVPLTGNHPRPEPPRLGRTSMFAHALRRSRWSLVALTAAAALAGCDHDDTSAFAPTQPPAIAAASRGVDLGQCTDLGRPQREQARLPRLGRRRADLPVERGDLGLPGAVRDALLRRQSHGQGRHPLRRSDLGEHWRQHRHREAEQALRGELCGHSLAAARRGAERRLRHLPRRLVHPARQHGGRAGAERSRERW